MAVPDDYDNTIEKFFLCPVCSLDVALKVPDKRLEALYEHGSILCPAGCGEIEVERPKPSPLLHALVGAASLYAYHAWLKPKIEKLPSLGILGPRPPGYRDSDEEHLEEEEET